MKNWLLSFCMIFLCALTSCAKEERYISYKQDELCETLIGLTDSCTVSSVLELGSSYEVSLSDGHVLKVPVSSLESLCESDWYWTFRFEDGIFVDFIKTEASERLLSLMGEEKTMACFGGSVCNRATASTSYWSSHLNLKIDNYAVGGAGFAVKDNSILSQVEKACSEGRKYDIYLFWCSTNDMGRTVSRQNNGIAECFDTILSADPDARIMLLTSIPKFKTYGYETVADEDKTYLFQLVEGQKEICEEYGVPYYDQFRLTPFTITNYEPFFHDETHPKAKGYKLLRLRQALFIAFGK